MSVLFQLGELPFDEQKFQPKLSAESFAYHYQRHHKSYVDNLAKFFDLDLAREYGISEHDLAISAAAWSGKNIQTVHDLSLIYIIRKSYQHAIEAFERSVSETISSKLEIDDHNPIDVVRSDLALTLHKRVFNNAAQHWNHAFFWESISHEEKSVPSKLIELIESQWGSFEEFKKCFYDNGTQLFGSGWVWLVFDMDTQKLRILQTMNAETPVTASRFVPLIVIDVWEHAYYIDYRNKRVDYLEQIINQLNWEFADQNLSAIR